MEHSITITIQRPMVTRRSAYNLAPLYVRCHGCGHRRASHNIHYCPRCGKILCYKCYVYSVHKEGRCVSKGVEEGGKRSIIDDGR